MPKADRIAKKKQRQVKERMASLGKSILSFAQADVEKEVGLPITGNITIIDAVPDATLIKQELLGEDKIFIVLRIDNKMIYTGITRNEWMAQTSSTMWITKPWYEVEKEVGAHIKDLFGSKNPKDIFAKITSKRMESKKL